MITRRSMLAGLSVPVFAAVLHHGRPAQAASAYRRAGWVARLSTRAHGVSGLARIVDARTVRLENFNYDGGGPNVRAYLATANTTAAIQAGRAMPMMLNRGTPYVGETVTLQLPDAQTLDGFIAISIWCADFNVNFGSGVFLGAGAYLPAVSRPE